MVGIWIHYLMDSYGCSSKFIHNQSIILARRYYTIQRKNQLYLTRTRFNQSSITFFCYSTKCGRFFFVSVSIVPKIEFCNLFLEQLNPLFTLFERSYERTIKFSTKIWHLRLQANKTKKGKHRLQHCPMSNYNIPNDANRYAWIVFLRKMWSDIRIWE